MKIFWTASIAAISVGMCLAQNATPAAPATGAAAQSSANSPRFAAGTELRAELDKTIDAKKAKAGEPVIAKSMDDLRSGNQVVAPRGSKIIGHVVAATPHEKGTASTLEIVFDKFDLGNGSEVPMKASIQALSKPVSNAVSGPDNMGQPAGGSSPMGGRTGGMQPSGGVQPSGAPNTGNMGAGQSAPSAPGPSISPNAQGVNGISGVTLSPGPAQDSVLTSEKHNVKLDSGTQMILRVQ